VTINGGRHSAANGPSAAVMWLVFVSWNMIDEGYSADKIAFWIGDTPHTVRLVYSHMLEGSSAPAAAAIDHALGHAA
jgi:hypothetical protein